MPVRPLVAAALLACAAFAIACSVSACTAAPPDANGSSSPEPSVIRVPADAATLAEAADRVQPGGVILIAAGTYAEQLEIDVPDVTVRGEDRNATVIDGGGIRPYGIVSIADGVTIENLTVRDTTFYGVLVTGLHDENGPSAHTADGYTTWDPAKFPPLQRFRIDHVTAHNNGLYGLYAFNAQHGEIRDSYASGSADSGIYVGQCGQCDILVTGNVAERNAVGFENANASDSVVIAGNRFSGNRVGMTLLSSYQEAFAPQRANTVVGNLISDNQDAATPAQAEGAFAIGVGVSGGVGNDFVRNRIQGNASAGVVFANTEDLPATGNSLTGNVFDGNGVDIANRSASRTPATANCADPAGSTAPDALAAELAEACDGASGAQSATDVVPGPDAPRGMSFRRVAAPRDQPGLAAFAGAQRLPDAVAMPDPASFGVPDGTFLQERAGAR